MTLYDAILLLGARWRWLLLLPTLAMAVSFAIMLVTSTSLDPMREIVVVAEREREVAVRRERRLRASLDQAVAERARVRARGRDIFALIEYGALTSRIESLHREVATLVEAPLPTPNVPKLPAPPSTMLRLLAAAIAGLVAAGCGVFMQAWWAAERAARAH